MVQPARGAVPVPGALQLFAGAVGPDFLHVRPLLPFGLIPCGRTARACRRRRAMGHSARKARGMPGAGSAPEHQGLQNPAQRVVDPAQALAEARFDALAPCVVARSGSSNGVQPLVPGQPQRAGQVVVAGDDDGGRKPPACISALALFRFSMVSVDLSSTTTADCGAPFAMSHFAIAPASVSGSSRP